MRLPFFIEFDKAQAEWVVVAYESDDPAMISAVEQGVDVHAWTAYRMSGLPIETILAEDRLLGKEDRVNRIAELRATLPDLAKAPWLPSGMSLRQAGKKSNHALNYDEGAMKFAQVNEMSVAEAKRLIALYHAAYPGIRKWHERIRFQLTAPWEDAAGRKRYRRTLLNCFGREMRFMGPLHGQGADTTFRAAYSCLPQSTVADIASEAMIRVEAEMPTVTLKSNNHDSLLIQHYLNVDAFQQINAQASEVSRILTEIERVIAFLDPILTSVYTGKTYRIRTDAKAGLCWGTLKAVQPTRDSVREMLLRVLRENEEINADG